MGNSAGNAMCFDESSRNENEEETKDLKINPKSNRQADPTAPTKPWANFPSKVDADTLENVDKASTPIKSHVEEKKVSSPSKVSDKTPIPTKAVVRKEEISYRSPIRFSKKAPIRDHDFGGVLDEDEKLRVGALLSLIYGVENGWEIFDSKCDDEGNLTREQWDSLFPQLVNSLLTNFGLLDKAAEQLYICMQILVGDHDGISKDTIKSDLLPIVDNAIRLFSGEVFRFLDTDGSGTISKKEFAVAASIGNMVSDPMTAIAAVFRMVDSNGNGKIETYEIADMVNKIVQFLSLVVVGLLGEFEKLLGGPALGNAILQRLKASSTFLSLHPTGKVKVSYERWIAEQLSHEGAPNACATLLQCFNTQLNTIVPGAPHVYECNAKFLSIFDTLADETGTVDKADAVTAFMHILAASQEEETEKVSSEEFAKLFLSFAGGGGGGGGVAEVASSLALLGQVRQSNVPPTQSQAQAQAQAREQLWSTFLANQRAFLQSGGLKRVARAWFNLVDVNNDDRISKAEMREMQDAIDEFKRVTDSKAPPSGGSVVASNPDAGVILVKRLFVAFCRMFDRNGDGTLDEADIAVLSSKLTEFVLACATVAVEWVKHMTLSTSLPLANFLLKVKAALIGGALDELLLDEIFPFLPFLRNPDAPEALTEQVVAENVAYKAFTDMEAYPDHVRHPKHKHGLVKMPSVYLGAYTCSLCGRAGNAWVYHCDLCQYDAHPACAHHVKATHSHAHTHTDTSSHIEGRSTWL